MLNFRLNLNAIMVGPAALPISECELFHARASVFAVLVCSLTAFQTLSRVH
jgi:hypothetical protein